MLYFEWTCWVNSIVTLCDSCLFLEAGLLSRQIANQLPGWVIGKTISWAYTHDMGLYKKPCTMPLLAFGSHTCCYLCLENACLPSLPVINSLSSMSPRQLVPKSGQDTFPRVPTVPRVAHCSFHHLFFPMCSMIWCVLRAWQALLCFLIYLGSHSIAPCCQDSSHESCVATKHLKYGWCDQGTEFLLDLKCRKCKIQRIMEL